jgi:hypothetical protein
MALTNLAGNYLVVRGTDFGYNVKIEIFEDVAHYIGPLTPYETSIKTNVYCAYLPTYMATITDGHSTRLAESILACEQALLDNAEYSAWWIV